MIKVCPICSKRFKSLRASQKFCSRKCRKRAVSHKAYRKEKERQRGGLLRAQLILNSL